MSKEIQCKCCKEYWWETDIHSKSGLCPNCYDYFANLEAKLSESQNQTAIAELEKVKEYNRGLVYSSSLIDKFIDNQIKSLKGEK